MNTTHFKRLSPEVAELFKELKNEIQQAKRPAEEVILDDVDLRNYLKVSQRTTATWRQKKLIKHSWIQGKCYYRLSDVLEAIDRNAVPAIHETIKIKL